MGKERHGPRGAAIEALRKTLGLLGIVIPLLAVVYLAGPYMSGDLAQRIADIGLPLMFKLIALFIPAIALAAVFGYYKKGDKRRLAACIAANAYAIVLMVICAMVAGDAIERIPLDMAGLRGTIDVSVDFMPIVAILCACPVIAMALGYLEYRKANIQDD